MEHFLVLGFLIGTLHACEADHLAAVGALAVQRSGGHRNMALQGVAWGLGHTITLLLVGMLVLIFGFALTDERVAALEFGVGAMLVLLGADVLRRMRRMLPCRHRDEHTHEHAKHDQPNRAKGFSLRALAVGLIHGAAGSASLVTMAVAATTETSIALAYVLLFGLGSIMGMCLLSVVASWPLCLAERSAARIHRSMMAVAGVAAMAIGANFMLASGARVWMIF